MGSISVDEMFKNNSMISVCEQFSREEMLGYLRQIVEVGDQSCGLVEHVDWGQEYIPMDIELATQLKAAYPALKMVNLYPTEPTEQDKEKARSEYGFEIE